MFWYYVKRILVYYGVSLALQVRFCNVIGFSYHDDMIESYNYIDWNEFSSIPNILESASASTKLLSNVIFYISLPLKKICLVIIPIYQDILHLLGRWYVRASSTKTVWSLYINQFKCMQEYWLQIIFLISLHGKTSSAKFPWWQLRNKFLSILNNMLKTVW